MLKFTEQKDVDDYVKLKPLPPAVLKEITAAIGQIQELLKSGFQNMKACVIISETEKEHKTILKEYGLLDIMPEFTEYIPDGKDRWQKSVYITDDSGDGVVVFEKLDSRP